MYLDTKLPTDSLYKFICILGLSIFLGGCLLYWNHYRGLLESSIEAEGALEGVVHELESERGALEKIAKEYEKFFSSIGEYKKDERGALYTPKLEAGRLIGEAELKNLLLDCDNSINDFCQATREYRAYRNIAYLIMVIGLVGMAAGIYLWYTRIQKYEDEIIRMRSRDQK